MIVVLSPDDLVYDFNEDVKTPQLKDFPALDCDILGPFDVVIYRYTDCEENNTIILKKPDIGRGRSLVETHGITIKNLKKR